VYVLYIVLSVSGNVVQGRTR